MSEMSEKSAIEALQDIGLTEYEARVYTALARTKTGIASEIHQISGIPRSAVYSALAKLEKKGIVEVQHSKPMRYRVISPARALETLRSAFLLEARNALVALDDVYHAEWVEDQREETIWMSRGAKNVYDKVLELIIDANREVCIIAYPVLLRIAMRHKIFEGIQPALIDAVKRGVKVRILCASENEGEQVRVEIPCAEVRVRPWDETKGSLLLVNEKYSLIIVCSGADAGQVTAIWTDGCNIVAMFRQFADAMWQLPAGKEDTSRDVFPHSC